MCGFVGYFGTGDYQRALTLDKMGDQIVHRGPDSTGTFLDDKVALSFRRLSIIDLEGGSQPIHSADGNHVIIFNGEIYNYATLRSDLIDNHNCVFSTQSDTEVILNGYITYGAEFVKKLRGMFAFVIYDKAKQTMFGARDYFGIKPFYYANMNDTFLFGSEIKSFLPHPAFRKEVNHEALKMYLIFQYTPTSETMFKDVYKLDPGSYFTYDGKDLKVTSYFDISYDEVTRTYAETMELIQDSIKDSVAMHQISDVEVGSFLSGGVDSSYIASTVKPMKTYSVGFQVDGFDETVYAKELCETLGMSNAKKDISSEEFFGILPTVQYHSDEPHANLSAVPLYFLSQLAAQDVKVVLSGEGADEMFGGYDSYMPTTADMRYSALVPLSVRRALAKTAKKRSDFRGKGFLLRNGDSLENSYVGQAFIMDNDDANAVLAPAYQSARRFQDITKPYFDKVKGMDDLHKKLFLDMQVWLPHDILLKADKMTMAHSLELRVPYLDHSVWSLARSIQSDYLVKDGIAKKVFRETAMNKIPSDWANRKKLGFMVPFRVWLKEDRYYNQVKEMFERETTAEFFDRALLLQWLDEHRAGTQPNQRKIYTVYAFLLWHEQYFILR